ncbi:hypothetical protein pb186bvf_007398 [Paramecium bursaria]
MDLLDDLLKDTDPNVAIIPRRNQRQLSRQEKPKDETDDLFLMLEPKKQERSIDPSPEQVLRKRESVPVIDKQKMAEVFQINPKPPLNQDQFLAPPSNQPPEEQELRFESRRSTQRLPIRKPQTKSDMNSSMEPPQENKDFEKILNQSDYSNKNLKEQPKLVKEVNTEQIQQIQKNFEVQIEQERKTRQELIQQIQDLYNQERARTLESHKNEIERIRQDYEREKQKAIDQITQEPNHLKNQLEQQFKIKELADQLMDKSSSLNYYKKELDQINQQQFNEQMRVLKQREQSVIEREHRQQLDAQSIENEKQRLAQQFDDIKRREQNLQTSLQLERDQIKDQKKLVQEMKDQIKNTEQETRQRLDYERELLQRQREEFEIQKQDFSSQSLLKQKQLDMERYQLDQERQQYREFTQKNNELIKQKYDEAEKLQNKVAQQEITLNLRFREVELKEHQVQQMHLEMTRKLQMLDSERQQLLFKLKELGEKESKFTKEITDVNQFRTNFITEKDQLQRQKQELTQQQLALQQDKLQIEQEKQQLTIMHKTLSSLRQEIAIPQTTQNQFARTSFSNQRPPTKMKTEKPPQSMKNTSSQNFDVSGYVNFLKNVDYLK